MYRHMLTGQTEASRLVAVKIWCAQAKQKRGKLSRLISKPIQVNTMVR